MWKVISSWFDGADAASRRQALALEALEKSWRERLNVAFWRRAPPGDLNASAFAALARLDAGQLLAIDSELRLFSADVYASWKFNVALRPELPIAANERAEIESFLFVAACHASGFIRERAVNAFEDYPSRVALAIALIRCDDWVEPVQRA